MLKLSKKQEAIIAVVSFLLAVVFVLALINISFEVHNRKLLSAIDENKEENENLRARYLSEIALNKLDSRALEMNMQHASHSESHIVSVSRSSLKTDRIKMLKCSKAVRKPRLAISGY